MTALQLGNCDLVRLRGTSDGGVAARLSWAGTCALAIRTRGAYGAERYLFKLSSSASSNDSCSDAALPCFKRSLSNSRCFDDPGNV
jgi:hypothetical protein